MKKYNFLFKPLFFIFSLVFATWLVLFIEKISPSDFGKYGHLFDNGPGVKDTHVFPISTASAAPVQETRLKLTSQLRYERLKKSYADYKAGMIDRVEFEKQLDIWLNPPEDTAGKEYGCSSLMALGDSTGNPN